MRSWRRAAGAATRLGAAAGVKERRALLGRQEGARGALWAATDCMACCKRSEIARMGRDILWVGCAVLLSQQPSPRPLCSGLLRPPPDVAIEAGSIWLPSAACCGSTARINAGEHALKLPRTLLPLLLIVSTSSEKSKDESRSLC